ncbi:MAG: HupE/UreJ family protein [Bacteroidota bacterium]
MKNYLLIFTFLFTILFSQSALGHAPDQSIIFISVYENGMGGRYEMEVKDINATLGTKLPKGFTVEEITPHLDKIKNYFLANSKFESSQGVHQVVFNDELEILELELGTFVLLDFTLSNASPVPDMLDITYTGVFDKQPNHQGVVVVEYNWKAGIFNNESLISLIFTASNTKETLDLTDASVMKGFLTMIWMGIWHIFIGLDHILFILALVLPAVVVLLKQGESTNYLPATVPGLGKVNSWGPVEKFKPAIIYVITIITFFTVSHCITLSLAALDIFNLPSRFVETLIALSIALAAWHNIRPIFKKDWLIAFGFGLFHGFGFASVLGDIGLTGEYMVLSLLGFNLGVELGQLAIICVIFPILFFLRNTKYYARILVYGSLFLIVVSMYWFVERAFDIDMPVDDYISDLIGTVIRKTMQKLS